MSRFIDLIIGFSKIIIPITILYLIMKVQSSIICNDLVNYIKANHINLCDCDNCKHKNKEDSQ